MRENEFNKEGIFQIPYHESFRIDKNRNIYILNGNNDIIRKIPYYEIKFRYDRKTYYPILLSNITFYGTENPNSYNKDYEINDEFFKVNDVIFKHIAGYTKDIHDFYGVSNNGLIYSLRRNELRKQQIDEDGYHRVSWSESVTTTNVAIHRIVYQTWVENIPDDKVIDHIDNNKWNNLYSNLIPVTNLENSRKAINDDLYERKLHLNEENIRYICDLLSKGYNKYKVIEKLGITKEKDPELFRILEKKIQSFFLYKEKGSKYNVGWRDILDSYDFKDVRKKKMIND